MSFVCVLVSRAWVWYCDALLYQNLFRKRKTRVGDVDGLYHGFFCNNNKDVPSYTTFCIGIIFVVICDLSYEHNCDLCYELLGLVDSFNSSPLSRYKLGFGFWFKTEEEVSYATIGPPRQRSSHIIFLVNISVA